MLDKAFDIVGWENKNTVNEEQCEVLGLQYDCLQFKNLDGQLRTSWENMEVL